MITMLVQALFHTAKTEGKKGEDRHGRNLILPLNPNHFCQTSFFLSASFSCKPFVSFTSSVFGGLQSMCHPVLKLFIWSCVFLSSSIKTDRSCCLLSSFLLITKPDHPYCLLSFFSATFYRLHA